MEATKITRRGSDMTKTFHLVVDGEKQLSTAIIKVQTKEEFRMAGSKRVPMEQYGFRMSGRKDVFERFADAAAQVIKKHQVKMAPEALTEAQIYVKRAFAIVAGTELVRLVPAEKVSDLRFTPAEAKEEQNGGNSVEEVPAESEGGRN